MIGQTLGGRYAVVRLLGEGGMGAVYEARHTGTGRRVAVKVITGEMAKDPRLVSRFEREARAAGVIESEHIVQVLDVGTDGTSGAPFLAMEYLVGEDVAQLFSRLGPVPTDLALRIGIQACLGLEKAHAAGIVHRDIKPANLFLSSRDSGEILVKLLDFGIAKVTDVELGPEQKKRPLTQTGAIMGSPLYMSPEQSRSKGALDHRTDLWSLGIVLYQALAGRTPLEHAESIGDFIVAVCTTRATPIRDFAPWVDPMVAAAVEHALAIDPPDRYQSAAEMRAALSVFVADHSPIRASMLVRAPEAGPAPPPPPPEAATVAATPLARGETPTPAPAGAAITTSVPVVTPIPGTTVPAQPVGTALAPPTPLPTGTVPTPAPGAVAVGGSPPGAPGWAPGAHGPLVPLSAVVNASQIPVPPPRSAPKRGRGALVAGLVVAAAGGGLAAVYALGVFDGGKATTSESVPDAAATAVPDASIKTAPPPDLSPLAGAWWAEGGVSYDGVVVGEKVELRIRDPELLAGQGYTAGEAVFVLRPVAGEPHDFQVEARIRPPPPRGFVYDHARAAPSCVASWTQAGGKPLRAVHAIDKLIVQTVKVDPGPGVFGHEGIKVIGCTALAESHAVEAETVLGRTPVSAPPKWVPPHDAGVHDAGVHDAGAHDAGSGPGGHDAGPAHDAGGGGGGLGSPCQTDAQCTSGSCANHRCASPGKGFGATCTQDAQCASRHCMASMCK